jgi:hypothetical protein
MLEEEEEQEGRVVVEAAFLAPEKFKFFSKRYPKINSKF